MFTILHDTKKLCTKPWKPDHLSNFKWLNVIWDWQLAQNNEWKINEFFQIKSKKCLSVRGMRKWKAHVMWWCVWSIGKKKLSNVYFVWIIEWKLKAWFNLKGRNIEKKNGKNKAIFSKFEKYSFHCFRNFFLNLNRIQIVARSCRLHNVKYH